MLEVMQAVHDDKLKINFARMALFYHSLSYSCPYSHRKSQNRILELFNMSFYCVVEYLRNLIIMIDNFCCYSVFNLALILE